MKLSDPIYFLMRVGIIIASIVILAYISKTKVIQDSKSKVKGIESGFGDYSKY